MDLNLTNRTAIVKAVRPDLGKVYLSFRWQKKESISVLPICVKKSAPNNGRKGEVRANVEIFAVKLTSVDEQSRENLFATVSTGWAS